MTDKEIYREIKQSIASGEIASLPKDKLVQFPSALTHSQAHLHFGTPQFPQICKAVDAHLAARLQQHASQDSSKNATNDHWYKKPIGIILLSVCAGVLVFLIKYLLGF